MHTQRHDHLTAEVEYAFALDALAAHPDGKATQLELARTHYLLGRLPSALGANFRESRENAKQDLEAAVRILRQMGDQEASPPEQRFLLALCLREQSETDIFYEDDGSQRAQAANLLTQLTKEFRNNPRYRFELSETFRARRRNDDQGERYIEQLKVAEQISEKLVAEHSSIAVYRVNLAHTYAHLAHEFLLNNDLQLAEDYGLKAIASHDLVVRDFPGLAPMSESLSGRVRTELAQMLRQQQRWEEIIGLMGAQAHQLAHSMATEEPSRGVRFRLEESLNAITEAYRQLDDQVGLELELLSLGMKPPPPHRRGPGPRPGFASPPPIIVGDLVDGMLSYDRNEDKTLTRDELPTEMARGWFQRFDKDENGVIDSDELQQLLD